MINDNPVSSTDGFDIRSFRGNGGVRNGAEHVQDANASQHGHQVASDHQEEEPGVTNVERIGHFGSTVPCRIIPLGGLVLRLRSVLGGALGGLVLRAMSARLLPRR